MNSGPSTAVRRKRWSALACPMASSHCPRELSAEPSTLRSISAQAPPSGPAISAPKLLPSPSRATSTGAAGWPPNASARAAALAANMDLPADGDGVALEVDAVDEQRQARALVVGGQRRD